MAGTTAMIVRARGTMVLAALSSVALLSGCAAIHRTRPLDMSVQEHRRAAREADERARDAAAAAVEGGRAAPWLRTTARREAELAAAHATAAERLEAEVRAACAAVPPRDVAPALTGFAVVRASRLDRPVRFREVPEGVGFVVATNGRPFDALAAVLRCRRAHALAVRDDSDPLSVVGAHVRAYRDDGEAMVVQIVSRDPARAEDIIRRVRNAGLRLDASAESASDEQSTGLGRTRADDEPPGSAPSPPVTPVGIDPVGGATRPGRR